MDSTQLGRNSGAQVSAPRPGMEASVPYSVGIVELAEGVHMFTRFFTDPGAELRVNAPTRLEFRTLEPGELLPVWVVQT